MDIKNIVDPRLNDYFTKHRIWLNPKSMPLGDWINSHSKQLASQISSDIKKELKLVASGKVEIVDEYCNTKYADLENSELSIVLANWEGKSINIYIEELDDKGKHKEG